jgi:hypothetical protein
MGSTTGRIAFVPVVSASTLARLTVGLLVLGLFWRTARYLLQFPIWGDEAMLAVNLVQLDYWHLTQKLNNCQVAPLLFLWGERAAFVSLGYSPLSLRLLPYLAGVVSVVLYWRLTRLMLGPLARCFAFGFLAVAYFPVAMSGLLKPYSCDLLMSLAITLPAVRFLRSPGETRWLACLTVISPVALLASYPAVLVVAGIAPILLLPAWRRGWRSRAWFAAFSLASLAGFALAWHIGSNQLHSTTMTLDAAGQSLSTQAGMNAYWADGFPPSKPAACAEWLLLQVTGQMSAYPVGSANGGSSLTVFCCIVGLVHWIRRERWQWVAIAVAPILLGLVAAAVHRYPFGAAARLSQHQAPGICILAGMGLAVVVSRLAQRSDRPARWAYAASGCFALIGVAGIVRDFVHPYRDEGCEWVRTTMRQIRDELSPDDRLVVCQPAEMMDIVFVWYLLNQGDRVDWADCRPSASSQAADRLWGFHFGPGADAASERMAEELLRRDGSWRLARRFTYDYPSRDPRAFPQVCDLVCFVRTGSPVVKTASKPDEISKTR